eukprot:3102740-Prymnesium_polylepis.1
MYDTTTPANAGVNGLAREVGDVRRDRSPSAPFLATRECRGATLTASSAADRARHSANRHKAQTTHTRLRFKRACVTGLRGGGREQGT